MSWATRGLRGSTLETLINMTNERYMSAGLAVVQKIPTPITPVSQEANTRIITKAFYERKSTVDYIGAAQGVPLCFDAKETSRNNLPLTNIHEHQLSFMGAFERQGGLAFLIVSFRQIDECYLLPFRILKSYFNVLESGGRKSIPYSAFEKRYYIRNTNGFPLHYLEAVNVMRTDLLNDLHTDLPIDLPTELPKDHSE